MLKPIPFANAAAIVIGATDIVCRLLVAAFPDGMFNLMQTWIHTVNLDGLQMTEPFSLGSVLWGLLAAMVIVWVLTYATVALYNALSGKK